MNSLREQPLNCYTNPAMHDHLYTRLTMLVIASSFAFSTNCAEPCLELSSRLCKCETSESAQQACVQARQSQAEVRPTNANEQEVCDAFLDGPQCQEETICGNAADCGRSLPNGNSD